MVRFRLEHIKKDFNGNTIFEDVNLIGKKGSILAVKGKSGVGKSTLLNIIAGLERPSSGKYYLNETEMHGRKLGDLARVRSESVGYISQHSPMISNLNAFENICVPLWLKKQNQAQQDQNIRHILELSKSFEIEHLLNKKISLLSGGEIQRVGIIRALVNRPELLIADEPTGSLDDETTLKVIDGFKSLKNEGMTIIIATHSNEVAEYCGQVFNLTKSGLQHRREQG